VKAESAWYSIPHSRSATFCAIDNLLKAKIATHPKLLNAVSENSALSLSVQSEFGETGVTCAGREESKIFVRVWWGGPLQRRGKDSWPPCNARM
jgi:hypothetical protein